MASRNVRVRLLHIVDEIDGVSSAIRNVTFNEYQGNYILRRTAERALQIISEAARVLPTELTTKYPAAPWAAIVGIGNILRHEYQSIDDRRLWEIVTVHLPGLRNVVEKMLADLARETD